MSNINEAALDAYIRELEEEDEAAGHPRHPAPPEASFREQPELAGNDLETLEKELSAAARRIGACAEAIASPDPKISLAAIRQARALIADAERRAVSAARASWWSWDQIGRLLGLTRQSVHKRYGVHRKPGIDVRS